MEIDKWCRSLAKIICFLFFCIFAVSIIIPIGWMILSSLKTNREFLTDPWGLPEVWQWENYVLAFRQGVGKFFFNSVLVTAVSVLLIVIISAMASYALSRFEFKWKGAIFIFIIGGMMISPEVNLVSLFKLMKITHLYNTHIGLIIVYCVFDLAFTVLLMRSYMLSLPKEIEESAFIDGCSIAQVFAKIVLPMCRPVLASAALLATMNCWNEYMFAAIFIESKELRTLPVGLASLQKALSTKYPILIAGLTMSAVVVIIAFLIFQKQFIRGLSQGSVKG